MKANQFGTWQPLGRRDSGLPPELGWYEGVPEWLVSPVQEWLFSHLFWEDVRLPVVTRLRFVPPGEFWYQHPQSVPADRLLDWIDATLHVIANDAEYRARHSARKYAARIDAVLRDCPSVWKVSAEGDALERREDPTVTVAARQAAKAAATAGRGAATAHLKAAWDQAYRLNPNPSGAYRAAILAVESAAIPVVVPKQAGATLGHVLGHLDRQGHLFVAAVGSKTGSAPALAAVTSMIRMLWEGHTDRHEGVNPATPISSDAAQMAVHLAATLVQWFSSGAVRRR